MKDIQNYQHMASYAGYTEEKIPPTPSNIILLEDGTPILLEAGSFILLEG